MKIAISAQGKELSSRVDPRFGRGKYFILIDSDTAAFSAHDNSQNLNALQGAGIQAARNVTDLGAGAVITGNVGPKAYAALEAASVEIYTSVSGTVQEALADFWAGKLARVTKATVEGHW